MKKTIGVVIALFILTGCKNNECANGDANLQDSSGRTALHRAASNGDLRLVKCLINEGAYINMTDDKGWTPLHSAALRNRTDIAKLLINHGAFINPKDSIGDTPLDVARKSKKWATVMFLEKLH